MTPAIVLLVSLPCVYWTQGIESRTALEGVGIKRLCVPPERIDGWREAGFDVTPITQAELASRETVPVPGIAARTGIASPTRSPWIIASGWRFIRHATAKYAFDVPAGKAALAAAEAFAYGVDAVLQIDPADLGELGAMLTFLDGLPAADLPAVADFGVVDDGSGLTGEAMNLLARRNLLFAVEKAPSPRFAVNVIVGSRDYPREEAADPSALALKIRRQLTDERRSLRVYGSEVVIGRLTSDGDRTRLHLINYSGREIEGLRVRLRGAYRDGDAHVAGVGRVALEDYAVSAGATEFSLPRIRTYAVIDLKASR
jgi:hypothetical protein